MKLVRCDKHPEREAVASFKITKLPIVGAQPFLLGLESATHIIDLCEECAELVRPFTKQEKTNG